MDGLRDDICASVFVHRPGDLDTAYSLALLQEEVADSSRRRDFHKPDTDYLMKSVPSKAVPLPLPPRVKRSVTPLNAHERKITETSSFAADKWATLNKAFRRAKGLCEKCAEKWSCDHRCAATVQLNVVQELLDLFQLESVDTVDSSSTHSSEQLCLALSKEVMAGIEGPRYIKLQGSIQSHPIFILVDSGSSSTFISMELAGSLSGLQPTAKSVSGQVADGGTIVCSQQLTAASWFINDYEFQSDLKVIPLDKYDMVLGMDWLEKFSPMKVHWLHKWLSIPYNGTTIFLQGEVHVCPEELLVHICSVSVTSSNSPLVDLPPEVDILLSDYAAIFAPVDSLPPARKCDHVIPLISGAKPVYIRPYRYPPALKNEIEKQVAEMLKQGIIQPSFSPFSSPTLLVKKKDGSWCFCIDYRYLNALTLKGKFPIPAFDELMDKLT